MDKVVLNILKLQSQLKVLHWQTESFAEHKAFQKTYESLDVLLDELVEVHQGKYGRIVFSEASLELFNQDEVEITSILEEVTDYLQEPFNKMHDPIKDTDCLNIRDEIVASLNKLRYLLTLK